MHPTPMDEPRQPELPLPFPELSADQPLLPARMVNEYQYCPRLAYLEWVQGEWDDSGDTVEGRHLHKRVDQSSRGELPQADRLDDDPQLKLRAITLSSNRLGLIARMDLIEVDDGQMIPVDYKHGKRPHVARGAYDPERVQLCAQGLLLREHGYRCDHGILYYAGSRERVKVPFDDELLELTRKAMEGLRAIAAGGHIPPPLEESPKCPRCSLVAICLPDEVHFLDGQQVTPRPLFVAREDALPLYVQDNRARIRKKGEVLEVYVEDEKVASVRINEISQLVIQGNAHITTPALRHLMDLGIPITWMSYGGWFNGHSIGTGHKNVEIRTAQYQASFQPARCRQIARGLVRAKILNSRTLLRRSWRGDDKPQRLLDDLKRHAQRVEKAPDLQQLLGIEGAAASLYFGHFQQLIRQRGDPDTFSFDFTRRNRRPPTDPVNALLSYAYALLVKSWTVALSAVGLDPYRGFYHQPRYGRPALALDLMEPFRPLIADSAVLQAINNGEVKPTDFIQAGNSVALTNDGRKRFIGVFERRMGHQITHPLFGYRISYRRLLELQSRLLARHLLGEIPDYPQIITR